MVLKNIIKNYDNADNITAAIKDTIETYAIGKYKSHLMPYEDKIRIAFSTADGKKAMSNIVISFAIYEGTLILLFGINDPDFIISKTKYKYKDPIVPFVLLPKNKSIEIDRDPVYKHIGSLVKMVVDKQANKPDDITIYLDMMFDEKVALKETLEDPDNYTIEYIVDYALDEIKYKLKNRLPIYYKFSNQIKFNAGDPDYEALFEMNMYVYGIYDWNGNYSIMINYIDRDPDTNFEPHDVTEIINNEELDEYVTEYVNTFTNRVIAKAFSPKSDVFARNVYERVY